MSENKDNNTESLSSNAGNSKRDDGNTFARNKYRKDFRNNRRNNDESWDRRDFKKNRGSYRGGYRDNNFGRKPFKRNWSNSQQDGKKKVLEVSNRLKENDVGITEFIGTEGFSGIIKERYTDFHVNEITPEGEISELTNQDIPVDVEDDESLEDLKKTVPSDMWDQLQVLNDPDSSPLEIDVTNMEKEQRRAIHAVAKKITDVVSQTVDKENKKMMIIMRNKKGNSHNIRRDTRVDWSKRGGDYCYFLLHKVNMDTMDALNQIAMSLRIKPNNFNSAGTKDRRAWTTQWVSLRKVEPAAILKAAKTVRGAYVGNFKFAKEPLKLGMLSGNHFRIALRNVTGTDEQIENAMTSLRDNGFINYYGLQRFGTVAAIPTYEIGKTLLQGKWAEAIELILKPRDGEQDRDLVEARKVYETTKDAMAAYNKIRRSDKIEAALLKGIASAGSNNPQGALDSIPRNARLMYIHAYQSFVWNNMVSKRIKEFGRKPIVGDLVYEQNTKHNDDDSLEESPFDNVHESVETNDENDSRADAEPNVKISKFENETKANTDALTAGESSVVTGDSTCVSVEEVTNDAKSSLRIDENTESNTAEPEKDESEKSYNLPAVKILTEEDLPHYTLADVIMPQVGWKVMYPTYAKPWFDEFLAKDDLTTDLRQKNKKYSLGGAYRKILQIPTNLSWKIMHYKEKHSDLILCDIDKMRKETPPKDEPEGQFKALIVDISLKSSTYATMALREILKYDTSPQAQAAQSAACSTKDCSDVVDKDNDKTNDKDNAKAEEEHSGTEVTISVGDGTNDSSSTSQNDKKQDNDKMDVTKGI